MDLTPMACSLYTTRGLMWQPCHRMCTVLQLRLRRQRLLRGCELGPLHAYAAHCRWTIY